MIECIVLTQNGQRVALRYPELQAVCALVKLSSYVPRRPGSVSCHEITNLHIEVKYA